eukprot:12342955-Alexandrium_andersonii.AAC.1
MEQPSELSLLPLTGSLASSWLADSLAPVWPLRTGRVVCGGGRGLPAATIGRIALGAALL